MNELPVTIPVGPQSTRVFAGYRLPSLDRTKFFQEVGKTFMPGTPNMLAPLGLNAYVAATLDVEPASGLPDEVALIVYGSEPLYTAARQNSVQGRMYTHSHAGVFDMVRSRGQFPGPDSAPHVLDGVRWSWFLFDTRIDWQTGTTRLVFLHGTHENLQADLLQRTRDAKAALANAGITQVIVVAGATYAAVWLHADGAITLDPAAAGLVPSGTAVLRDLVATPVPMPTLSEGVEITGAAAFSFRFTRELRHYLR